MLIQPLKLSDSGERGCCISLLCNSPYILNLADLYDELAMPPELRKAHQQNDRAVMEAYGNKKGDTAYTSESACVAELMRRYQKLTAGKE